MIVLAIFLALVAAFSIGDFIGMASMLVTIKKISPAAYSVFCQELKWRKAERKAWKGDEYTRR